MYPPPGRSWPGGPVGRASARGPIEGAGAVAWEAPRPPVALGTFLSAYALRRRSLWSASWRRQLWAVPSKSGHGWKLGGAVVRGGVRLRWSKIRTPGGVRTARTAGRSAAPGRRTGSEAGRARVSHGGGQASRVARAPGARLSGVSPLGYKALTYTRSRTRNKAPWARVAGLPGWRTSTRARAWEACMQGEQTRQRRWVLFAPVKSAPQPGTRHTPWPDAPGPAVGAPPRGRPGPLRPPPRPAGGPAGAAPAAPTSVAAAAASASASSTPSPGPPPPAGHCVSSSSMARRAYGEVWEKWPGGAPFRSYTWFSTTKKCTSEQEKPAPWSKWQGACWGDRQPQRLGACAVGTAHRGQHAAPLPAQPGTRRSAGGTHADARRRCRLVSVGTTGAPALITSAPLALGSALAVRWVLSACSGAASPGWSRLRASPRRVARLPGVCRTESGPCGAWRGAGDGGTLGGRSLSLGRAGRCAHATARQETWPCACCPPAWLARDAWLAWSPTTRRETGLLPGQGAFRCRCTALHTRRTTRPL